MKKIFTLVSCVMFATAVSAQQPVGVIAKATAAPVIDGVADAAYSVATVYSIDKPFQLEVPTVGESGETTWQAMWNADGVYVLLNVIDDTFYPNYSVTPAGNNWEFDKPEIYFDVNYTLVDAVGAGAGLGHYQVAPGFTDGSNDGTPITQDNGVIYAFKVTGSNYVGEYFIPFELLLDSDENGVNRTATIGFDVTIIDRDAAEPVRQRMNWGNDGNGPSLVENYTNMDDAGLVTFEGAVDAIMVDKITVSGGSEISAENGILQLTAVITPAEADNQKLKWVIENGTGEATVDNDGLVTAVKDGTVLVKAMATDGSYTEGKVTVTISGQTFNETDIWNTFNKISNWNFDKGQTGQFPVSWGGWIDKPATLNVGGVDIPSGLTEQGDPVVEEGVCILKAGLAADAAAWHYQVNQSPLSCEPNVPYTLKFKTWSTADATPCVVDFESGAAAESGEQYNRYGASSDLEAIGGRAEWNYIANIEPRWVEFHVTFDQINEGVTIQKIQWMFSLSNETISLDSVLLVKDSDILLKVPTLSTAASKVQLYPNPAQNELTVSKIAVANSKVSVYNAVGQKVMEKTAIGNQAKFNVASLRKGMYFVRLSDGSSQKFIKE